MHLHEENAKYFHIRSTQRETIEGDGAEAKRVDGGTVHVLAAETISAARQRLARLHSKNKSSTVEDRRNPAGGKDERRDSGGGDCDCDCNCDCAAKTDDPRFRAMLGGN